MEENDPQNAPAGGGQRRGDIGEPGGADERNRRNQASGQQNRLETLHGRPFESAD
jgi:hypothetical protein